DDLLAGDVHVRGALQHDDRLFLARMVVHGRRLSRLVAGDLRPELIGLEEHLAHALVGGEAFQRVEVEHLCDARGRRDRDLIVHGASRSRRSSVYSNGDCSSGWPISAQHGFRGPVKKHPFSIAEWPRMINKTATYEYGTGLALG